MKQRAFTLIELLVVVAIIAILMTLLVPSFNSIALSNRLTSGAQMLVAELNKSRQDAIARNRAVEVRFYNVPPKDDPSNTDLRSLRAIQSVVLDERAELGGARFGRLNHLPSGTQISTNSVLTTTSLSTSGTTDLPNFGSSSYGAFRFRPDGGTDMTTNAFWTLVSDRATEAPPANFATIQIDSRTGRVRLFRP